MRQAEAKLINKQAAWQGPTSDRLIQSMGHVVVGDDQQGGRVYHFKDSALERIYERLKANARTEGQRRISEGEERALERYFRAYVEGGLNGSMRSVDLNNACMTPGGRDHAAKTDFQVDSRADYHAANGVLTDNEKKVVMIVVLCGSSLEDAGRALGKLSRRRAIQSAEKILRTAGSALADLWRY